MSWQRDNCLRLCRNRFEDAPPSLITFITSFSQQSRLNRALTLKVDWCHITAAWLCPLSSYKYLFNHGSKKHLLQLNLCPIILSVQRIQLNLCPWHSLVSFDQNIVLTISAIPPQSSSDSLLTIQSRCSAISAWVMWSSELLMKLAKWWGSFRWDTIPQTLTSGFKQCL